MLLPLRDEATRVAPCLRALLAQRGVPGLEIVVLDDGSTDGTAEVVRAVAGDDPRVTAAHRGRPPPPGWLGKPHACQQLADPGRPGRRPCWSSSTPTCVLAPHAVAAAVTDAAGRLGDAALAVPPDRRRLRRASGWCSRCCSGSG